MKNGSIVKNINGILGVSAVTANELLQGEFKTFDEFEISRIEEGDGLNNINILYRELDNETRKGTTKYIIETIFIDE